MYNGSRTANNETLVNQKGNPGQHGIEHQQPAPQGHVVPGQTARAGVNRRGGWAVDRCVRQLVADVSVEHGSGGHAERRQSVAPRYHMQIGQVQTYMLTVVPTTSVITWTTSAPNVLTIDSSGDATGIANGFATITAVADNGQSGSLLVQVVPVYGGTWAGSVTVIGCSGLVGFAANSYCSQVLGAMQAFTMSLTQTNSNVGDVVSGTFTKGEGGNTLSGSVR